MQVENKNDTKAMTHIKQIRTANKKEINSKENVILMFINHPWFHPMFPFLLLFD